MGNASCVLSHGNVMSCGSNTSRGSAVSETWKIPHLITLMEMPRIEKCISTKEFSKQYTKYGMVSHMDTLVKVKL